MIGSRVPSALDMILETKANLVGGDSDRDGGPMSFADFIDFCETVEVVPWIAVGPRPCTSSQESLVYRRPNSCSISTDGTTFRRVLQWVG